MIQRAAHDGGESLIELVVHKLAQMGLFRLPGQMCPPDGSSPDGFHMLQHDRMTPDYARLLNSSQVRVRFHIIRNARIESVGKSQSCMVSLHASEQAKQSKATQRNRVGGRHEINRA